MDDKDLKIQALLQRIAELTAEYENRFADLRVNFTKIHQELESYKSDTKKEKTEPDPAAKAPDPTD